MRLKVIALSFVAALSCSASSVIYVDSLGAGGPVTLLIDQVNTVVATCLNRGLPIAPSWEADLLAVTSFPVIDQKPYLEAAWLSRQFALSSDWQGIHDGIWNLFGSYREDGVPWVALAETNYATIDPKSVYVLIPIPLGYVQNFIVFPNTDSPEPATCATLLIGLALGCGFHIRIRGKLRARR